jgi:predicted ArsR family transcriptional regulator
MKTIRQLADELHVSKQAIRQKLNKLNLQTGVQTEGNRLLISEDAENMIRAAFNQTAAKKETQSSLQTNQQLIEILQSQLATKDQQIKTQTEQIETLTRLVDQSQKLQGIAESKLKALEDKQAAAGSEENNHKSLWKRIFHKEK